MIDAVANGWTLAGREEYAEMCTTPGGARPAPVPGTLCRRPQKRSTQVRFSPGARTPAVGIAPGRVVAASNERVQAAVRRASGGEAKPYLLRPRSSGSAAVAP